MPTKKEKMIYGVAALLLIVLVVAPILNLSVVGVSPLSCDNAAYKSSDPNYANGSLFCAMVLSGSGASSEFIFDNSFVKDKFGVQVEKTGTFTASMDGSMCAYRFSNETNYLYTYITNKQVTTSNGKFVCGMSNTAIANYERSNGVLFIGNTPISCKSDCYAYKPNEVLGGCEYVFRKTEGAIHYLDPSIFNDFSANLSMKIGDETKSGVISQTNPTSRNDFFTAELLGGFQGQQTCPAQPATTAFIANAATSAPLSYKGKFTADAVLTSQLSIVDAQSAVQRASSHNAIVQQYLASAASAGQYCSISTTPTTSINDAKITCTPVGTTNIPVFNLYVAADKFVIVKPSGSPRIDNVSVGKTEAATRSEIIVKATNLGEADSFDFAVKCAKDLNPFSTRANLNSQETKTVAISYEGAGLIGDCEVSMTSVNSPDKIDTETVKLTIYPFCARSAPSTAHEKVITELGCAFICPSYGTKDAEGNLIDAYDTTCGRMNPNPGITNDYGKLEDYDRCNYVNNTCTSKDSFAGLHCTGIGKYATTNSYMDGVVKSDEGFTPEVKSNKYFIVTLDGRPVCDYVNEYGFKDGVPVSELVFDYSKGFPEASEEQVITPAENEPEVPEIQKDAPTTQNPIVLLLIVAVVGAIAFVYLRVKKK